MRTNKILPASAPTLATLALALATTPALAGHVPAGPAGGPAAVGATIVPNSKRPLSAPTLPPGLRALMQKMKGGGTRWAPGLAGFIELPKEQAAAMAARLSADPAAITEGSVIAAPTTMAGDAPATILLDTATGRFGIVRNALIAAAPGEPPAGPQAVPQEMPKAPESALTPEETSAPAVKQ